MAKAKKAVEEAEVKEEIVLQSRSTTFSRGAKTSLRNTGSIYDFSDGKFRRQEEKEQKR